MGGQDKGLLQWNNRMLIEYAIDKLRQQLSCLLINCNRHVENYLAFELPIVEDSITDYAGPLAGILAAMQHTAADFILVVPCDCPTIPLDLFQRLANSLSANPATKIAIAHDGIRSQPLFGLYHVSLRTQLQQFLANDNHKVHDFIQLAGYVTADYSDNSEAFRNFNSPGDMY